MGVRLIPLLLATGHEVSGMTRSGAGAKRVEDVGGRPVVCDVFDRIALFDAVTAWSRRWSCTSSPIFLMTLR